MPIELLACASVIVKKRSHSERTPEPAHGDEIKQ